MAGLGGCAKAFAQLVRSGTGFTTFPYAGQECVDLHALKSKLATAMIDRLMHHGEAMVIQGNSFRTKGDNPDDTKGDKADQ